MSVSYIVFKKVTKDFSDDRIIGRGGFANVYKGELPNGELIAVKLLHSLQALDDKLFKNEVCNLFKVDHPNVVGLLGYCDEIHSEYIEYKGEKRLREKIYRVLCFEYFPGGTLDKHLHEQSVEPDWSTRYNIIKGICAGLNYLHGCEPQILHLDLKPANILLDNSLIPKLADFGLSRAFGESHTHNTQQRMGTNKYMPPEYIKDGKISVKNDVYSLGVVMIEIMEGYSLFQERDNLTQFKQEVLSKWSSMIGAALEHRSEQLRQLESCIDIAISCIDSKKTNRPTVARILEILNKTETGIPITQLAAVSLSPTKNSLVETLKKMTAELDNVTHPVVVPVPGIRDASSNVEKPLNIRTLDRVTTSSVEEELIIGRTEEKQKILSILSRSSKNEMIILPIYGIGGIGKTTMAQLVFNDTKFSRYFRVWVYVSEKLDFYKIGNSIISQLSNKKSNIDDMQMLHNHLAELFADKRILIVLDDLWEDIPRELDKLKSMLRLGKGSKVIIVTTRDEAIARKICSAAKNEPYKLENLTADMCWAIIKQKSDFENHSGKKLLESIGIDIAIKCGGVALAAQSLGYTLRDMTSDEWESVRDSDIWNSYTLEDPWLRSHEVLASLQLSYFHMHACLQSCFLYCAVFPKGHKIAKYDLIHQWIALEFAKPSGTFGSMQLCERYIGLLLGMSFLQRSMAPSSMSYHSEVQLDKDAKFFTMHDLVHDLGRAMLADKVNKNGSGSSSCQYALLTDPSKPLQLSVSSPENIKALHFLDCAEIELCDGAFSPAKYLVVLDLSGCLIQKIPDSIGQLKQLRYLHAPRIQDNMIPNCITKLSKLNYLNLRHSHNIKALPDSIGDLKDLMYLDLSGCYSIGELPVSFTELKQLVHLDLSDCSMSASEYLSGFTKLQYLNLQVRDGDIVAPMHNKRLPEVIGNLTKLRYLNLTRCSQPRSEIDVHSLLDAISTISSLENLDFSDNYELNSIPESIGNLMKLHTLGLSGCDIRKLPTWMDKMVNLKIVNVQLNGTTPSRSHFASLPVFVVHASPSEGRSNIMLLERTNPDALLIRELENVVSVEEAQSIKLFEKSRIKSLTFQWFFGTRYVPDKDLLEKLVPPNSVENFRINGYTSRSFPANWLMDIVQYLPRVSNIGLSGVQECNHLPPLGQLRNLEILELNHLHSLEVLNTTDSSGEVMFPKLHTLRIFWCPKLRIKPCLPRALSFLFIDSSDNMLTSMGECVSQNSASYSCLLTKLVVKRSSVPLYQWIRFLQHVSSLRHLSILNCSDLTSCQPEDIQRISYIESFTLQDKILTELPTWLAELTSLQDLLISLPMLKLNDNTRQLTRLQRPLSLMNCMSITSNVNRRQFTRLPLSLTNCMSITSLPQWLGGLTSIKKLHLTFLPAGRITLPGSIRRLTKLELLQINDCTLKLPFIRKMLSLISADTDEVDIRKLIEEYKKEQAKEDTTRLKEIWPFLRQLSADTLSESGSTSIKPWELHMFKEIVAAGDFTEDQATTTGIILPGKTKKYWVDKNGNNCFMLFPKGMSISWAENPDHWTWHPLKEGSGGGDVGIEVVELKGVFWLEIVGKQELSHLTPRVTYEVVFEAMLKRESFGWQAAVDLRLKFPDGRDQNHKKSLHGMYSVVRLQLKAGEMEAREGMKGELVVSLSEHGNMMKMGLVVKCIRITPKE